MPKPNSNRVKSRTPSKSKFWCGCDTAKVGHVGKCPSCGRSMKGRKDKQLKETSDDNG